jgi:membrane protease YdiL (CAAX protease family)
MKKIGDFTNAIIPFLVAVGIQLLVAASITFLYGFVTAINLFSSGEGNHDTIENAIFESINPEVQLGITAIVAIVCLIIFGIWYKRISLSEEKSDKIKRFSIKTIIVIILLGIGLQISLSFILNIIASIKPDWFNNYGQVMEGLGRGSTLLSAIYIGLIAPISEEFIFRGVTLKKAQKVMPFIGANILQAILFGVYHGNLVQGVYAFILGLFLGFVCYQLQSLLASILLHMVINISGILFGFISVDSVFYTTGIWGVVSIAGIAAAIVGTFILRKKEKTSDDLY